MGKAQSSTPKRRRARPRREQPAEPRLCACGCKEPVRPGRKYLQGHSSRVHPPNLSHGLSRTPEYQIWHGILQRCWNPKNKAFDRYGGRGIKIADRWKVFSNFLADVGRRPSPRHSLDRINNEGDYEPANVRWALNRDQGRNQTQHGGFLSPVTPDRYELQPVKAWPLTHLPRNPFRRRHLHNPWCLPNGVKLYAIHRIPLARQDRLAVLWNRADRYTDSPGVVIDRGDQQNWGFQVVYIKDGVVTQGVHVNPHQRDFVGTDGDRPKPELLRRAQLADYDLALGVIRRLGRILGDRNWRATWWTPEPEQVQRTWRPSAWPLPRRSPPRPRPAGDVVAAPPDGASPQDADLSVADAKAQTVAHWKAGQQHIISAIQRLGGYYKVLAAIQDAAARWTALSEMLMRRGVVKEQEWTEAAAEIKAASIVTEPETVSEDLFIRQYRAMTARLAEVMARRDHGQITPEQAQAELEEIFSRAHQAKPAGATPEAVERGT
jgi:hypothetical protein